MSAGTIEKIREIGERLLDPVFAVRLVEESPDAIIVVRGDGTIAIVNKQAELLFGYHRNELYGEPIHILVPAAAKERHLQHVTGYMADPRQRPMGLGLELSGMRKDGAQFPAEINLSPFMTSDGFFVAAYIRRKRV